MKKILLSIFIINSLFFFSCERLITPDITNTSSAYIIDAFLTTEPDTQFVKISTSISYFEQTLTPGVSDASVVVYHVDSASGNKDDEHPFVFQELDNDNGTYVWIPEASDSLGSIGTAYLLEITIDGELFIAESQSNRVPKIDSIWFVFEEGNAFIDDFYYAQFLAKDFEGQGDTYWIRSYKNSRFNSKPEEINVSYDAAPSPGTDSDGIVFIEPIQNGINSFENDEETNRPLPPFNEGDTVQVELWSVSNETFDFLSQILIQSGRDGGFAALFDVPLANVSTNIFSADESSNTLVYGFFNVANVSKGKRILVKSEAIIK